MKFYVVKNQSVDLKLSHNGDQRFSVLTGITSSSAEDVSYRKFEQTFNNSFGNKKWEALVRFSRNAALKWDISVESKILSAVQRTFYYGRDDQNLKIEMAITGFRFNAYYNSHRNVGCDTPTLTLTGMVPQPMEVVDAKTSKHECYEQLGVTIPPLPNYSTLNGYPNEDRWTVSVSVIGTGFVSVVDILPRFSDTGRKILSAKKFCDFEIISEDGTTTPCHKVFLLAKSPVLAKMVEGKFKEAKESKMTMSKMSTRGVTALLEFLYCDDVDEALRSPQVSLELLKAADVYDIPALWEVMIAIITEEPLAWFDVDVALNLYEFLGKCPQKVNSTLTTKMLQVLAEKSMELDKSTVFNKLFPNSVAKAMFVDLLESYRP